MGRWKDFVAEWRARRAGARHTPRDIQRSARDVIGPTGDLLSSFFKRRLGIESSRRSLALDLIPEAALPVLVLGMHFGLGLLEMMAVIALIMLGDLLISPILVRLGIRGRSF